MTDVPLLEVHNLTKQFSVKEGILGHQERVVKAVDGVSFRVDQGRTFSLVDESGCGKSTTANILLLLEQRTSGRVTFRGEELESLSKAGLKDYRRSVQAVFQDPYSSLSPRMRVRDIIAEPLKIHEGLSGRKLSSRVGELLEQVGLSPDRAALYPHQFSGGQRQRIAIARALSLKPALIVLDEPVSALDVSIRAQILNLLTDLQEQLGLSYLLISHDLAIVEHMSHEVAVMYAGQFMEMAPAAELYGDPLHPYTRSLIAAVPSIDPDVPLEGLLATDTAVSVAASGCKFHPRCPLAPPGCAEAQPRFIEVSKNHFVQYCNAHCTPVTEI